LTKQGIVKLMDLGLARTVHAAQGQSATEGLTSTGAVMGTADYIAPEQALNAKSVDIRADIYSLGCSLYQLLAGRVPFPGETMTEKLLCHQLQEPEPIERIRTDLPTGLPAVVRKVMAKKADQRYQVPAELAAALGPFSSNNEQLSAGSASRATPGTFSLSGSASTMAARGPGARPWRWGRWLLIGGLLGAAAMLCMCVLSVLILGRTNPNTGSQVKAATSGSSRAQSSVYTESQFAEDLKAGRIKAPNLANARLLQKDEFDAATSPFVREWAGKVDEITFTGGRMRFRDGWSGGLGIAHPPLVDFASELVGRIAKPPKDGWGMGVFHSKKDKGKEVLRGFEAMLRDDGKLLIVPSRWSTDQARELRLGPFVPPAVRKGADSNALLVRVRGSWVEIYVNGVAACAPFVIDYELSPTAVQIVVSGGGGGSLVELERLTLWSTEDIPSLVDTYPFLQKGGKKSS
jgi:protein kinase-like protein